ncbi:MAG: type II secretion system major pseudopilin GspG [Deltaproteobacteria bacterium]|nr:type II secretion system major pseudopilin GspG [Deltaproteobacteria bacterium]
MTRVQGQSGFTLIEIMVVVFILGLLVALVGPKIMGRTDDARVVKAKADVKGIEEALHLFKLDCGRYPSTGEGLEALVARGGGSNCRKYSPEGYLDKVPHDPWDNRYAYFSNGQDIIIKSYGADGQEGGEGKNADIDSRALD